MPDWWSSSRRWLPIMNEIEDYGVALSSAPTTNSTAALWTEAPDINVYFLGPLGSLVWLPPTIILCLFFVFFTYSFIQFHAENRERYVARRNRLMMEVYTTEQLTAAYSEETLNDILPKRRLRPFALKMDIKEVLKDIWRCHGANPRKLQALLVQMQMQMIRTHAADIGFSRGPSGRVSTGSIVGRELETRSLTSLEYAHYGMSSGRGSPSSISGGAGRASRRGSGMTAGAAGVDEGGADRQRDGSGGGGGRERGSLRRVPRQLPATPPLSTSQRPRPILQKAASLHSSFGRGGYAPPGAPHAAAAAGSSSSSVNFAAASAAVATDASPPPRPPLPSMRAMNIAPPSGGSLSNLLAGSQALSRFGGVFGNNHPFMKMMSHPRSFEYYPGTFANLGLLGDNHGLDEECDNDFVAEGGPRRASTQGEKKKAVNVLMMQKLYKRN